MTIWIKYGFYLDPPGEWEKTEYTSIDKALNEAYHRAYENAQGFIGLHGFGHFDEDEIEQGNMDELIHDEIELAIEYEVCEFAESIDPNEA